jgi:hypothetical protein
VLDALGAGALRVPAVLGLIAPPGDELRGVLAAGGMVVVPQDGDAASTVIARLLMAYLATPPAIGRATLMLADPALVAPDVLRDQVIQIVAGERADVLLRMTATDAGWRLSGPDGAHIAELLPDLMAQPSAGTGALVETIVQAIGPAPAALAAATSMSDEPPAWWDGGERNDDLDAPDDELAAAAELPADEAPAAAEGAIELPASAANELVAHQDLAPVADELALDVAPAADSALALAEADVDQPTALDLALGGLLNALMAEVGPDAAAIREAITAEDFAAADALAAEWAEIAATDARPWRWRVVLAEDDADRAAAAYHALRAEPDSPHTPQLSAVLDALGLDTSGMQPLDQAPLQVDSAAALDGWPVRLDDELGGEHEIPSADVGGWEVLDEPTAASSADARPDADHVALELISTPAEVAAAPLPVDTAPAAGFPNPIVAYAAAEMPIMVPTTAWTAPAQPAMSGPIAPPAMPATAVMDDAAIRAAWQGGESVPDLIARLVAAGESAATARARVRQAISTRPAAPSVPIMASIMPAILPPPPPPVLHLADMNGILAPSMLPDAGSGDLDNEGIWRRWQAGEKTDDMVYALCGRRGGPKADTARDRIYAVVVPRIVAELGADDLVDRICAGADVTGDPRYAVLMQRLARSEMPPAGSLEQSLRRRLIAARQEV